MTPIFPIIELVDRYAIAKLKFDKTFANQNELEFYQQQLSNYNVNTISDEIDKLYNIHAEIWNLEFELKTGLESHLSLEEIGRRAIKIRDWNNKRITLKNHMASVLNCAVREIKKDHLSE